MSLATTTLTPCIASFSALFAMRLNALTCATVLATASVVAATEGFDPREYAKLKKHTTCKAVKRDEGDKPVDINMSESVSPPCVLPTP